jgi:hypothetical protein
MQGSLEDNNGYPEVFFMQHWGLFSGFNGENVQFWPNFFSIPIEGATIIRTDAMAAGHGLTLYSGER